MKSKLLLMTLALMSTLSSKCAYGMLAPVSTNKCACAMSDSALTLPLKDTNMHIAEVALDMFGIYCQINNVEDMFYARRLYSKPANTATYISSDIVQYLKNAKDSHGKNFMETIALMLLTDSDDINKAFEYASENIDVLNGYLCAAVNKWQLHNGPERFADKLLHFLLKYKTLSDAHYRGVFSLIDECKKCGGKINYALPKWRDEAHQNPENVLLQLIECIASTNTIAQCRDILKNPQAADKISFYQIDIDGIASTYTPYTGTLRRQLYVRDYHIKLGVLSDASNCEYMAMGDTKNSLMDLLMKNLKLVASHADPIKKMIAYEILRLAKEGSDVKKSFFSNALAQLPEMFDRANADEAFNLAVNVIPNYLQFLKNNDIKMQLIKDDNDQLSGVIAAIAYSLHKDLVIVDEYGTINCEYLGYFAETIYIVNANGNFQKGVVIK